MKKTTPTMVDQLIPKANERVAASVIPDNWRVMLWNGGGLWIGCGGGRGQAHAHHAIQISLALSDQIRLRSSENDEWSVYSGAIILPHQRHQFDSGGKCAANIFVEPETTPGRILLERYTGAPISSLPNKIIKLLVTPLRTAFTGGAGNDVLIAACQRAVALVNEERQAALSIDPRITRAIEYLRSHLRNPVTLAEAAGVANLSPSRFRHLFVAQTGISFRAYLLWARVEFAVGIAMGGQTWTEAAQNSGFSDSAHFSRTCRRMFGIAPSMLIRE